MKRNTEAMKKARSIKKGILEKAARTMDHYNSFKATCTYAMSALTADIPEVKSSHQKHDRCREMTEESLARLSILARQWRSDLRKIDTSIVKLEESMENAIMAALDKKSPLFTAVSLYGSENKSEQLKRSKLWTEDRACASKSDKCEGKTTRKTYRHSSEILKVAPKSSRRSTYQLQALSREILNSATKKECDNRDNALINNQTEDAGGLQSGDKVGEACEEIHIYDRPDVETHKDLYPHEKSPPYPAVTIFKDSDEKSIPSSSPSRFYLPKLINQTSLTGVSNSQISPEQKQSSHRRK